MWGELPPSLVDLGEAGTATLAIVFVFQALREMGVTFPGMMQGMLIYAGFQLTSSGELVILPLLVAVFLGSIFGSVLIYSVARFWGVRLSSRFGKRLGRAQGLMGRARTKLERAGLIPVFIGRLIPGLMIPTSLVSGSMRLPAGKFVAGVVLSLIVWAGVFIGLGAIAGHSAQQISPAIEWFSLLWAPIAGGALAIGAAHFLWRRRGKRRLAEVSSCGEADSSNTPC